MVCRTHRKTVNPNQHFGDEFICNSANDKKKAPWAMKGRTSYIKPIKRDAERRGQREKKKGGICVGKTLQLLSYLPSSHVVT